MSDRKQTFKELRSNCSNKRDCLSIYNKGQDVIFKKEFLESPHCCSSYSKLYLCKNCEEGFHAIKESMSVDSTIKKIKKRNHGHF